MPHRSHYLDALRAVDLSACQVDALTATVEVQAGYAGLVALSQARAGPPAGG